MAETILHRPPRAALYGRVSTTNRGQDVGLQTRELRQFSEARGWQIFGEYLDEGICGAKDSRPELNRLMADAHKRRFDIVCVWRFDRFARSVSHLLRALETFKALGIDLVDLAPCPRPPSGPRWATCPFEGRFSPSRELLIFVRCLILL